MLDRLLVPLDGSAEAESILPHATVLAKQLGQPILLLLVLPWVQELRPVESDLDSELALIRERRLKYAEEYLASIRAQLEADGVGVTVTIKSGVVGPTIIETATEQRAGAILIATHGRSGAQRWVLGSVADGVLRTSQVPVLVCGPADGTARESAVSRILLPLDGSPRSEEAIPYAVFLAESFKAQIIVIRTVSTEWLTAPGPAIGGYADGNVLSRIEGDIRAYVDGCVADLRAAGVVADSHFAPFQDPGTEIVNLTQQAPGSLVVMTSHGRSGLRRAVLGSVTDAVIRRASAPVLVVPTSK